MNNTATKAQVKLQQTKNSFDHPTDTKRLVYGFLNGAVDVFPYDSLPDLCRDNVTSTKKVIEDLFINNRYKRPEENLEFITAFSGLLTYPYGISFACGYGASQVFRVRRKNQGASIINPGKRILPPLK